VRWKRGCAWPCRRPGPWAAAPRAIVAGLIAPNARWRAVEQGKRLELFPSTRASDNVGRRCWEALGLTPRQASNRWRVVALEWNEAVNGGDPPSRAASAHQLRPGGDVRATCDQRTPSSSRLAHLAAAGVRHRQRRSYRRLGIARPLHEPYRWGLIQGGRAVHRRPGRSGAWGVCISGSRPKSDGPEHRGQGPSSWGAHGGGREKEGVASTGRSCSSFSHTAALQAMEIALR